MLTQLVDHLKARRPFVRRGLRCPQQSNPEHISAQTCFQHLSSITVLVSCHLISY